MSTFIYAWQIDELRQLLRKHATDINIINACATVENVTGADRTPLLLATWNHGPREVLRRDGQVATAEYPPEAIAGRSPRIALTGYQLRRLAAHYGPLLADDDHIWIHPTLGSAEDESYDVTTAALLIHQHDMDTVPVDFPAYPEGHDG